MSVIKICVLCGEREGNVVHIKSKKLHYIQFIYYTLLHKRLSKIHIHIRYTYPFLVFNNDIKTKLYNNRQIYFTINITDLN